MTKKFKLGILILLFSVISVTGCSSDKKETSTQEPPKQETTVQTDINTKETKSEEVKKEEPKTEQVKPKEEVTQNTKIEKIKSAEEYKKALEDVLNEEDKILDIKVDSEKGAVTISMSLKNSTPLTDVDIAKSVYSQVSDELLNSNEVKSIKVIFENIGELELSTNYKKINEYNLPYFPALLIDEKFKTYKK
nr:MAG TPA: protein of unknown function (DUF4969) [Caudoviricetes sp.]